MEEAALRILELCTTAELELADENIEMALLTLDDIVCVAQRMLAEGAPPSR